MDPLLRLAALRERLRESLWVIPTAALALALTAGFLAGRVDSVPYGRLEGLLFSGDADSARLLLSTLLGALVTVAALVLSITVVALQIASQQFSPRLLRRFLRDRGTQVPISVLLATYGYSMAVLQSLPAGEGPAPRVAMTVVLVLALASLAALVYFIHDITRGIRVEAIMLGVEEETADAIRRAFPDLDGRPAEAPPDPPADAEPVFADRSGYLQAVDVDELREVAVRAGAVVRLEPKIGSHVARGGLLAWAWPAADGDALADPAQLGRRIGGALQVGFERTMQQDAVFGVGQLVDMAVKALSPAVNDPRTATEAVHHLSVLLCELGRRDLRWLAGRDDRGTVRAIVDRHSFDQYLALACDQIRRYAASEPVVLRGLLEMLGSCAGCVDASRREVLLHHVDLVEQAAVQRIAQPADVEEVTRAAAAARRAISRLCRPVPA